jgi:predicted transcriptional regulator
LTERYNQIITSLTESTNELNRLTAMSPSYNNALLVLYNEGNAMNLRVIRAREVYEAMSKKYEASIHRLKECKEQLERARN